MTDLIHTLLGPYGAFLRYALIMGLLASVAFGIIGSFVVARRISFLAGAMAHSVLGGIGFALFAQAHWDWAWFHPRLGALVAALVAAMVIGLVSLYAKQREDTVIGAIWAAGMALGLIFIAQTPGYLNPMSYLFGNILLITPADLWLVVGLDILIVGLTLVFFNLFQAVCFDEEFSRVRGVRVERYYLLLLGLTAVTIVLFINIVGIVLVIALLILPAAVAGYFSNRLSWMAVIATLFCMAFTISGLSASFLANLPSGPTIILLAASVFLVVIGLNHWRRGLKASSPQASSK